MLEVHDFISTDTAHTAKLALRSVKSSCISSFMTAIKNIFKPAHLTKNSVARLNCELHEEFYHHLISLGENLILRKLM